jgi:acetylornithine deacetylase
MSHITPELHDRLRTIIAGQRQAISQLLLDLVAAESVTGHEAAVQDVVARELRQRGLEPDIWEATPEEIAPFVLHVGDQEIWDNRPNIAARRSGRGGGPTLMLQGHIDTVPIEDPALWTTNPAGEQIDNRIYGRGADDMKGGVASFIAALDAVEAAGIDLAGDVLLATTVGEEDGGVGALSLILRGYRADGIIITEPTERKMIVAHGGSLVFRITITGRGAHGADRNSGVSAFEKFIPIFQDLLAWEQERNDTLHHPLYDHLPNKFPISVGVVRAGTWASTVPESLVAEGRLGFLPGETLEDMMAAAEERILAVAAMDHWLRDHPPVIEWFGGQFASCEVSPDEPVARALAKAHQQVTGEPIEVAAMTAGLDLRLFTEIGKMVGVAFGAGSVRNCHCPDEFIDLDEMMIAIETLALTIIEFCGIAAPAKESA